MSTPLTDSINALTTYANEVTGTSDTTLSDAVHTLASGYGGSATLITKTITENGTYSAEDDSADGYSSVTVNVPTGGGASSWTKVAETSYQVSTTSTSSADVAIWETGHRELWNSDKMVYVRIRDTEGTKDGYFFGTDNLFWNSNALSSGASSSNVSGRVCIKKLPGNEGLSFFATSSATGYGVYADTIYSDGYIRIRKRYSSNYSLTIDGTYKIEVYMIDYPIPFYE